MSALAIAPVIEAADARSGRWLEDPGFGVYVHIPFCLHRCQYCDFNTYEGRQELHSTYVDALVRAIETWDGAARPATSVFFGGGTPTLLPPLELARLLRAVRGLTGLAPAAETTIEANPETVDQPTFETLLEAGFERFSIGVQSLSESVLAGLGRRHAPEVALRALRAARRAGVRDLSVDLIYGSAWEEYDDWRMSLERVIEEGPDHVSAYALTIEEGTPLATLVRTGRVPDVDADVQAERHALAHELLAGAGYEHYEVSNWARPGRASRHNVLYWSAGDYLGFGAGAHGHLAGRRSWAMRLPRDFIVAARGGRSTEAGFEELTADARAGEALMLGLRLVSGIDLAGFHRRFGAGVLESRANVIADLVARGLLIREGSRVRLSSRALLVANEVICNLL